MDLPRLIAAAMLATLIAVKAREMHLARHAVSRERSWQILWGVAKFARY